MTSADLLAEIAAFLARPDVHMTETTFGRLAVNDGKFVGRLRDKGGLTLRTLEKARAFMIGFKASGASGGSPQTGAPA